MSDVGLIVLAAGASSRMGSPKQLLQYGQETLLAHVICMAAQSRCAPIIVVLGANCEAIKPKLCKDAHIVENPNWAQGISTSLKAGIQSLLELAPQTEGVVITTCDQPAISAPVIDRLLTCFESGANPIVACQYSATLGVPALFGKSFFDALCHLEGDVGAKNIIKRNADRVSVVEFAAGALDIDTPTDYRQALQALER